LELGTPNWEACDIELVPRAFRRLTKGRTGGLGQAGADIGRKKRKVY